MSPPTEANLLLSFDIEISKISKLCGPWYVFITDPLKGFHKIKDLSKDPDKQYKPSFENLET